MTTFVPQNGNYFEGKWNLRDQEYGLHSHHKATVFSFQRILLNAVNHLNFENSKTQRKSCKCIFCEETTMQIISCSVTTQRLHSPFPLCICATFSDQVKMNFLLFEQKTFFHAQKCSHSEQFNLWQMTYTPLFSKQLDAVKNLKELTCFSLGNLKEYVFTRVSTNESFWIPKFHLTECRSTIRFFRKDHSGKSA